MVNFIQNTTVHSSSFLYFMAVAKKSHRQQYSTGFFEESDAPAKTHRRHNLLYAVRKLTREVTTLGREGVLPWYKGKGSEMENPELYFLDLILVHQKCKLISFNQLFLSKGQSLYVTSMVKPPTFKVYFFGIQFQLRLNYSPFKFS